jgi:hypothetical protein
VIWYLLLSVIDEAFRLIKPEIVAFGATVRLNMLNIIIRRMVLFVMSLQVIESRTILEANPASEFMFQALYCLFVQNVREIFHWGIESD